MPLAFDETDLCRDQKRAEEHDVVADRGAASRRKRVAGSGGRREQQHDREWPDVVEVFLDDDAGAGRDQHHPKPGERAELVADRNDFAANANQHPLRIRFHQTMYATANPTCAAIIIRYMCRHDGWFSVAGSSSGLRTISHSVYAPHIARSSPNTLNAMRLPVRIPR